MSFPVLVVWIPTAAQLTQFSLLHTEDTPGKLLRTTLKPITFSKGPPSFQSLIPTVHAPFWIVFL